MYIRIYGQHCVSLHLIFFWHEKQYIFTFIRILSFSFTQKCFLNIKYLVTSLKIEQHQQKKPLFVYLVPYWWTCRFLSNFNPCFKLWWNKHLHVFLRLCRWVFFLGKVSLNKSILCLWKSDRPFNYVLAPLKIISLVIVPWLEAKHRNPCSR